MKRKKWSEQEEQTLLNKYSSLLSSGTLSKLKTREKKFKPIAEHVNSTHHLQDPTTFPFVWSWRDVSIKVQNMRHQYLGVKQKIRLSKHHFSWKDGENYWVNFLMYKDVFGDVEDFRSKQLSMDCEDGLGLGFGEDDDDDDDDAIGNDLEQDGGFGGFGDVGFVRRKKLKMGFGVGRLGLLGSQVLELRDVIVRREEKRRECEFNRENCESEREDANREMETRKEECEIEREEALEKREIELEDRQTEWARKENEKWLRVEREFDKEHHWRMKMEEKKEEEEMEWRERMISLQMEHEKAMIQMQADACQNQMQLVGVMARFMCHFFGSVNDGLVGGLGNSPPQILQNLQLPGGLDDNGKPVVPQILCSASSNRTLHLHERSIPRLTVSPTRGFVMSRAQGGKRSRSVILATLNPESCAPQQKRAKIPDFSAGIPFGCLVLSDGLVRFIFSSGHTTLHSNVFFGNALLALSSYSLYIWTQGKSSLLVILGQAVLSWALFGKNLHDYTLAKKFVPSGFCAFNCAAMACFYLYVVASGGNPPQKQL